MELIQKKLHSRLQWNELKKKTYGYLANFPNLLQAKTVDADRINLILKINHSLAKSLLNNAFPIANVTHLMWATFMWKFLSGKFTNLKYGTRAKYSTVGTSQPHCANSLRNFLVSSTLICKWRPMNGKNEKMRSIYVTKIK